MAQPKPGPWKKATELADELGVHRTTVWDWVRKGAGVEAKRLAPRTFVRLRLVNETAEPADDA